MDTRTGNPGQAVFWLSGYIWTLQMYPTQAKLEWATLKARLSAAALASLAAKWVDVHVAMRVERTGLFVVIHRVRMKMHCAMIATMTAG
jgi:hypothetical protein